MFMNQAFAADAAQNSIPAADAGAAAAVPAAPPSDMEMLIWNGGFIAMMVVLFYLLLIRPQQTRYRDHSDMLKKLHKGDKVILQSGMIAIVDHVPEGGEELTVELNPGNKVHVMRSAIAGKYDDIVKKG